MNQPIESDLDALRSYHKLRTAKPSRDALLQSAKQWTTAARERAHDAIACGTTEGEDMTYIIGALGHVLRILEEAGK